MVLGLAIDYDLLLEEFLVDRAIEDVPDDVVIAAGGGIGVSII